MNIATGTVTTVHYEDDSWWAESTARPGWTAVADNLDALNTILAEPLP
jgi:hypothetical protein